MIRSMHQALSAIARNVLDVPTLECRNSDSLDFHELSVWQLREALEKAYRAGIFEGGRP
jgi:hypothetical protein